MTKAAVYFIGTPTEVGHHARPLQQRMPVQIVSADDAVQVTRPGDLAIVHSEHFEANRRAVGVLKKNRVATLYLVDGILEWRNSWENRAEEPACPFTMRPVLADKVACIGPSQARVLDSWGNSHKTEVVGIPRFDLLPPPQKSLDVKREDARQRPFRLLVMTAKTPGFTDQQLESVRLGLQALKNWLAARRRSSTDRADREIEVVWRLTAGLDSELGVANQLQDLSGADLSSTLQQVDAVISTHSTAMLEAMRLGLPVAALDYHNCPNYLPTAWNIRCDEDLEGVVIELLNPAPRKLFFQDTMLADALFEDVVDETATDRLEKLVITMLQIAADQRAGTVALKFPPKLLADRATIPCQFPLAQVFPDVPEFLNHNTEELQAELAHTRREIEHLLRVQAQLQSELSQAHQIFETIHRHPIAGPIVRIRQRMLDWMERFGKNRESSVIRE